MTRYCSLLILLALFACNKQTGSEEKQSEMVVTNDTVSKARAIVSPEAVATYSEPVADKDKLNNWKFSVDAFETAETFKYKLAIQYKELRVKDTITVPNFGIAPRILLKKGAEDLSCLIGFAGKDGDFKELKIVKVDKEQLSIKKTKHYARTLVKKK